MSDKDVLIYKSEPSIELPLMIGTIFSAHLLIGILMLQYNGILRTVIYTIAFVLPFILIMIYMIKVHEVKIFNDRIYCKAFKSQNKKLKTENIYFSDIISAHFIKTIAREVIEVNTNDGKYLLIFVDNKKLIPELKKQLKDKWK